MRKQVLKNIAMFNLKLVAVLTVLMCFALKGEAQISGKSNLPIIRVSGTYIQGPQLYKDETVVFFIPIASDNAFNPKTDAHKLMNTDPTVPNIYTIKDNQKLAINALEKISDNLVIPVGYDVQLPGTYTIEANQIANIDLNSTKVYLEDLAMNISQDLTVNPQYIFSINPADKGSRFFLRFKNNSTNNGVRKPTLDDISIYSSSNSLYVNSGNYSSDNLSVYVFNTNGQKMFETKKLSGGLHKFDLNLVNGCYIVKCMTEKEVFTQKVLIH